MGEKQKVNQTNIPKCPICGNPANKTNVHLIPWFIIKYYVTEAGGGARDKELSFSISSGHFTRMFAGRSVLPDKLEEFGDLHDLEKEQSNPYARDYLWCSKCEEKFSRLEAIFAVRFKEEKIRSMKNLPTHNNQDILIDTGFDNSIYQLFVQSIFWRCSVGKFDGFTLDPPIESKITENLREAFKQPDFLQLKAGDQVSLVHSFPLLTSFMYAKPDDDPTINYIMINKANSPYFIMAEKWLFQLFVKDVHTRSSQEWLYGLRTTIDASALYPKVHNTSHAILLTESVSNEFHKNRLDYIVVKKRQGILRDIRGAHKQVFGRKPSIHIEHYIYKQYLAHREAGNPEFQSFILAFLDLKKL
ncbi:hypothetical protein [Chitinophaga sp. sic0106]|uniref:hypothetical protein n=1 Tax=Chitinophaga sp. sic0106 TaxID=2854785 RepID=UPI001C475EF7|nr:hypothetical protein [Chitinophaga sp. sic0106]MBV7530476.1 hypothetical protein [Chitinophaga sp. sic0106]